MSISSKEIQREVKILLDYPISALKEDFTNVFPKLLQELITKNKNLNTEQKDIVSTVLFFFLTSNPKFQEKMREVEERISFQVNFILRLIAYLKKDPSSGSLEAVATIDPKNREIMRMHTCLMEGLVETIVEFMKQGDIISLSMDKAISVVNQQLVDMKWLAQMEDYLHQQQILRNLISREEFYVRSFMNECKIGIAWPHGSTELEKMKRLNFRFLPTILGQDRCECSNCRAETSAYMPYRDHVTDHKLECDSPAVKNRKNERSILRQEAGKAYLKRKEILFSSLKDANLPSVLHPIVLDYVRNQIADDTISKGGVYSDPQLLHRSLSLYALK